MNRIFLALKAQIDNYNKLQSDFSDIIEGRWIAADNLHITICYFGDIYSVDELLEKLPSLIVPIEPIALDSLEYFEKNRILYARATSETLNMLNSSISDSFSISQTKQFIPHATLMRVKEIKDKKLFANMLKSYKSLEIGRLETTLQLMSSHIKHPGGAEYECIKRFEL